MAHIPIIFHPDYDIDVPITHRFNGEKFSHLYGFLRSFESVNRFEFTQAAPVSFADVRRTHDQPYVKRVSMGDLTKGELRQINLPMTARLIKRSFIALNGTYVTAKHALERKIACHAAGGTHHAHFAFGSGFCVFNDLAFTALNLRHHGLAERVLILDLDVHQGDGTIDICDGKKGVYTCSIHCADNFPFVKRCGSFDLALPSGTEDRAYLNALHKALDHVLSEFMPQIVLYDAGVDVSHCDRLGNFKLSHEGILERDRRVLSFFKCRQIPVATVIGGGYSPSNAEVAARHMSCFHAACDVH